MSAMSHPPCPATKRLRMGECGWGGRGGGGTRSVAASAMTSDEVPPVTPFPTLDELKTGRRKAARLGKPAQPRGEAVWVQYRADGAAVG